MHKLGIVVLCQKIVITGVGAVTCVGIGADVSYKAMCDGKSGIRKLPSWADEFPAQVNDDHPIFDPYQATKYINPMFLTFSYLPIYGIINCVACWLRRFRPQSCGIERQDYQSQWSLHPFCYGGC